jgi:hypothetical protein
MFRHTPAPFTKKSLIGWIFLILIALYQLLGFVVTPNRFLTLEGHRYGMYMFEANHQCKYTVTTYATGEAQNSDWSGLQCTGMYCLTHASTVSKDGQIVITRSGESASAWNRCDPYEMWSRIKYQCAAQNVERVSMQFDHSINGGPFYRIVDEPSICDLTYKPFSHNDWIKVPPESPVVGYPVQNQYEY